MGSGIEFLTYFVAGVVIMMLDGPTFGLLGLTALIVSVLIFLRDFNGGSVSIAKRVGRMRVVDRRTGEPATNLQAFSRNLPYFGLFIASALIPLIDVLVLILFLFLVFFDILLILANPQGRRFGDILAGTQVVAVRN